MNHDLLNRIATWLEAGAPHETAPNGSGFNMVIAHHPAYEAWRDGEYVDDPDCGSACCIAGAAIQFAGLLVPEQENQADPRGLIYRKAAKLLGLSMNTAISLFFPDEDQFGGLYEDITPQEAAGVIRHLQKTGEVDWRLDE